MHLPIELLDLVLCYLDDYKMVLVFKKYISTETIRYLLRNVSINLMTMKDNIQTIKNMLLFKEHTEMFIHFPTMSENLMRNFPDKIHWRFISKMNVLTENFIEEFAHLVDWKYISQYQVLSLDFIKKNINKLDKLLICQFQDMPFNFKKKIYANIVKLMIESELQNIYNRLNKSQLVQFKKETKIRTRFTNNKKKFNKLKALHLKMAINLPDGYFVPRSNSYTKLIVLEVLSTFIKYK